MPLGNADTSIALFNSVLPNKRFCVMKVLPCISIIETFTVFALAFVISRLSRLFVTGLGEIVALNELTIASDIFVDDATVKTVIESGMYSQKSL